jgi:hypothetical protein
MAQTALRPRYRFTSAEKPSQLWAQIKRASASPQINLYGLQNKAVANHFIISYPKKHRHFWSPTIDLNFSEKAVNQTQVRVLFGPAPAIWTFFMFGYAVAALLVIGGLVLGYSQYILGHNVWLFALIPAGGTVGLLLLFASYFGKYRAEAQTRELRKFLETALQRPLVHEEN